MASLVELSKAFKLPSQVGVGKPKNLKTHFLDGTKKYTRSSRKAAARKAPGLAAMNPNTAANPFSRMKMNMGMKPIKNPFNGSTGLR